MKRPCKCTAAEHSPETCDPNCGCPQCWDTEDWEWTVEHLGAEATEEDLAEFVALAGKLAERDGITAEEAGELLYGNGDYRRNAVRLGL